jgi:RsiG-like
MTELDPSELPIDELRALRAQLLSEEDAVSYVRRLAQARLDLLDAELRRRADAANRGAPDGEARGDDGATAELADDLPAILGGHLTGGPARPPRPAEDVSGHPLAIELENLCARLGSADVASLDDAELAELQTELRAFEQDRSRERQDLFARLDALSAELVRRYREGGVTLPSSDD